MTSDSLANELERQSQLLRREMPARVAVTTLGFAVCAAFVDPWIVALVWLSHMAAEAWGLVVLRPERILQSQTGFALALAQAFVVEVTYMLAAGMVWFDDSPFAKAYAVGLTMGTLLHLATIRAIHLPQALAGLIGASGAILVTCVAYWVPRGDYVELAISAAATFAGVAYTLTAVLSTNRLHRSMAREEDAARRANEAKSLFLAQMSHELRTPLNAVIGMGEAELAEARARAKGKPAGEGERLQTLVENARALATILDDVTDMDAIAQGRLSLRPRIVVLGDEIAAITQSFKTRAMRLGIPFTVVAKGSCPGRVSMDAARLRQCLGNLLSNALRHAPDGPISATLDAKPDADGAGGVLVIDVTDSGPGVPEAQREAIFDAFRKGREARPGQGLGLAIARSLARRMGGDLVLLPSQTGAAFRLMLRYDLAAAPDAAAPPPDLTGRTMLVVDDIATNRLVAATYLRTMGARVIEAPGGESALELLASEDVDLVLLDMNMPGLDGTETARRARALGGALAGVPILAMTADAQEAQIQAYREAGLDGHVAKPILPETLAAELRRFFPA